MEPTHTRKKKYLFNFFLLIRSYFAEREEHAVCSFSWHTDCVRMLYYVQLYKSLFLLSLSQWMDLVCRVLRVRRCSSSATFVVDVLLICRLSLSLSLCNFIAIKFGIRLSFSNASTHELGYCHATFCHFSFPLFASFIHFRFSFVSFLWLLLSEISFWRRPFLAIPFKNATKWYNALLTHTHAHNEKTTHSTNLTEAQKYHSSCLWFFFFAFRRHRS